MGTTASGAPLVIARGGAAGAAPEYTIAALELALAHGADGLWLDLHLSRDGHPVAIHDFSLDRTTDGRGRVRDHSVRELKRLDAGRWRGPEFTGQRVQMLQEVLERFRDRTRFWIELRAGSDVYPGIEERVVGMVEIYDVVDGTVIQSADRAALARCRGFNRELRLGAVIGAAPVLPPDLSPGEIQAICPSVDVLGDADARALRQAKLECYVWTVDEPAQVARLVEWSVTGIATGRPDAVRRRLDR